jgi:4-hydroxythreonine-4-phosphate dehydrogenase
LAKKLKKMVISAGDPYGIGPEVTIKALIRYFVEKVPYQKSTAFIWIGPKASLESIEGFSKLPHELISDIDEVTKEGLYVIDITEDVDGGYNKEYLGNCTATGGKYAYRSLDKSISYCLNKKASALITAPISKEAMQLGKTPLLGHTEDLSERANNTDVVMILAQQQLRVALLTVHIPISDVPKGINETNLNKTVSVLLNELTNRFAIDKPKIALLGLNPHAGENGYIGTEEQEILIPFINQFNKNTSYDVLSGPFAADGFFGSRQYQHYDAVLAMYHDQGLVGFKSLAFGGGVNVTAGLPFVRTSPDHGTAYAIAGKNCADESSMLEALTLANKLSDNL